MAKIKVNLSKIKYNAMTLSALLSQHHIDFTPVIKCVAGDEKIVEMFKNIGITHVADARISNIQKSTDKAMSYTLIRNSNRNELENLVHYVDTSIQTELATIRQINEIASNYDVKHNILLMVDWKDAREGVLTYDVIDYIKEIINMHHIYLKGLAFNFMCFNAIAPTEEDVKLINQFITSIEGVMHMQFDVISGGNSSMLLQMLYNDLGKINELRIGETLFRGIETTTNHSFDTLYQNAIILETEIVEIKPRINVNDGQHYLQAIVDIGNLDTDVNHIQPLHHQVKVLGATSDHLMIDLLNNEHYHIGDRIQFSLGYKALAQSMFVPNLPKDYKRDDIIEKMCYPQIKGILNKI